MDEHLDPWQAAAMLAQTVSDNVTIAAPAELVYDLITDIPHIPAWVAECDRCAWIGGAGEATVGARFRGHNRKGRWSWSTVATVTAADPGRTFAFRVSAAGLPVSVWSYEIEATPGGCSVTESATYRAGFLMRRVIGPLATGVRTKQARIATNQQNIAYSLAQLKSAAEARVTS